MLTCTLLLGAAWCSDRSWGDDSQRPETRPESEAQGSRYTPEEMAQLPAAMLVLEQIVKVDDGFESVAANNSVVRINTTEIDKVVAQGPNQLPMLVAIMKIDGLKDDKRQHHIPEGRSTGSDGRSSGDFDPSNDKQQAYADGYRTGKAEMRNAFEELRARTAREWFDWVFPSSPELQRLLPGKQDASDG
jgi:hypothetical protein